MASNTGYDGSKGLCTLTVTGQLANMLMNAVFTRSFKKSKHFKIFMVVRSKFVVTAQL